MEINALKSVRVLSPADCDCNIAGTVSSVAECAQVSKLNCCSSPEISFTFVFILKKILSVNTVFSFCRDEYAAMQLAHEYLSSKTEN